MQATAPTGSRPAVEAAELAQSLLELWRHIAAGVEGAPHVLRDELDLSLGQAKTLNLLNVGSGDLSVKDLGERLGLSLPAASRTVDSLCQRGWVTRREDTSDRRVKRISLTEDGRVVVRRLDEARLHGLEAFAATLTEPQRRRLHESLRCLGNQE